MEEGDEIKIDAKDVQGNLRERAPDALKHSEASREPELQSKDEEILPKKVDGTPTRSELLEIVRKHSGAIPRPGVPKKSFEFDVDTMDSNYWREMLDLFFVSGAMAAAKKGEGTNSLIGEGGASEKQNALFDDMLFFVRKRASGRKNFQNFAEAAVRSLQMQGFSNPDNKPYFVRRWSQNLDKIVEDCEGKIDWRRSYFLNLICHTDYSLTVGICSRRSLEEYHEKNGKLERKPLELIRKVTKRVFASPSQSRFDINAPKATATIPSYPYICFAVDDYDDTFEGMVLTDPDHCFCVMLNATSGAALPLQDAPPPLKDNGKDEEVGRRAYRRISSEARRMGEASEKDHAKVTLFAGFVSHRAVKNAFLGQQKGLFWNPDPNKPEKLTLRGPQGRGEADVAVSGVAESEALPPDLPSLKVLHARLCSAEEAMRGIVREQQSLHMKAPEMSVEERQRSDAIFEKKMSKLEEDLEAVRVQIAASEGSSSASEATRAEAVADGNAGGIGGMLYNAVNVAAKQVVDAIAEIQNPKTTPIRCCLMSLSLPWDALAWDLLFKDAPLKVNISGHVLPRRPKLEEN